MGSDDRLLASWILIAGSLGVGLWYYRLHPYGQLRRVGQAAAAAAGAPRSEGGGTPAPAPVSPGTTPGYAIPGLNYGPPQLNPGTSGGHAGIGP